MIKTSLLKLRSYYFYLINYYLFFKSKVKFYKNYQINGIIFISNMGFIKIGNLFQAQSGKRFNPIGGDTILRLICGKNATIEIGNNCGIANSTLVAKEHIKIGNNVLIGGSCRIWDNDFHSLDLKYRFSDKNVKSSPIEIKDNVFIGGGCILLKGVTIGENSIIAAGSVITKSIPENEVWGGNPARFIKKID